MSNDTYLAVFLGSKTSPKMAAWNALSEAERKTREREGIAAWKAWVEKHHGAILEMGGPLGKTWKIDAGGVTERDIELFEQHPSAAAQRDLLEPEQGRHSASSSSACMSSSEKPKWCPTSWITMCATR